MLNHGEENFRLFLVENLQVLTKQRTGHLRERMESLETQKPSRERWELGRGRDGEIAVLELNK